MAGVVMVHKETRLPGITLKVNSSTHSGQHPSKPPEKAYPPYIGLSPLKMNLDQPTPSPHFLVNPPPSLKKKFFPLEHVFSLCRFIFV